MSPLDWPCCAGGEGLGITTDGVTVGSVVVAGIEGATNGAVLGRVEADQVSVCVCVWA